jgi:hypothetical protein
MSAQLIRRNDEAPAIGSCRLRSNENGCRALTAMPNEKRTSDSTGPMGMQPPERGRMAPTQMQPMMPGCPGTRTGEIKGGTKPSAPEKKQRTRTEAVRAALARITRRNSLRKQRDAQKR